MYYEIYYNSLYYKMCLSRWLIGIGGDTYTAGGTPYTTKSERQAIVINAVPSAGIEKNNTNFKLVNDLCS